MTRIDPENAIGCDRFQYALPWLSKDRGPVSGLTPAFLRQPQFFFKWIQIQRSMSLGHEVSFQKV
jgi:hypothetical protein